MSAVCVLPRTLPRRGISFQINFTFLADAGAGPVTESTTPANSDGQHKNMIYLDRHRVMAPSGSGIKGFRLVRPSNDTIAFKFWTQRLAP